MERMAMEDRSEAEGSSSHHVERTSRGITSDQSFANHTNADFHGGADEDESPEASGSFHLPHTPHLNRYSHGGQVPSCDARRSSSLQYVSSGDVNDTASPEFPESQFEPSNQIVVFADGDPPTPIKRLDFSDESDKNTENDEVVVSQPVRSFSSTPDYKHSQKLGSNKRVDLHESPIPRVDDMDRPTALPFSFTTSISHIENVRHQLHHMLKLGNDNTVPQGVQSKESSTSQSLESQASVLSFPPGYEVNTLQSHSRISQVKKVTADVSLISEIKQLKDTVEKERLRRKHCEKRIQDLNSKLLEVQQELAVAVGTGQRKDKMISQLDSHLSQVVEGWKKRESEKEVYTANLIREKDALYQDLHDHKQMVKTYEREMEIAVVELKKERELAKASHLHLESQMAVLKNDVSETKAQLRNEREKAAALQMQLEHESESLTQSEILYADIRLQLETANECIAEKDEALVEMTKTSEVNVQLINQLRAETENLETELKDGRQRNEDLTSDLATCRNNCKDHEVRLNCLTTELDGLKVNMALMKDCHENQMEAKEMELRNQLEAEAAEKVLEMHRQHEASESRLQQANHLQVSELTQKHAADMQRITAELQETEKNYKIMANQQAKQLEVARNKIEKLEEEKHYLQTHRAEALAKLQGMWRSQWMEAQAILSSPNKQLSRNLVPEVLPFSSDARHGIPIDVNVNNPHHAVTYTSPNSQSLPYQRNIETTSYDTNSNRVIYLAEDQPKYIEIQHQAAKARIADLFSPQSLKNHSPSNIVDHGKLDQTTRFDRNDHLEQTMTGDQLHYLMSRSNQSAQSSAIMSKSAVECDRRVLQSSESNDLICSDWPGTYKEQFHNRPLTAHRLSPDSERVNGPLTNNWISTVDTPGRGSLDRLCSDNLVPDRGPHDDEDGVFSPMPDFGEDDSTVAPRDTEAIVGSLAHTSPHSQVTETSPHDSVSTTRSRDPITYNASGDTVNRRSRLSYYVNMLLQQSRANGSPQHSPVLPGSLHNPVVPASPHNAILSGSLHSPVSIHELKHSPSITPKDKSKSPTFSDDFPTASSIYAQCRDGLTAAWNEEKQSQLSTLLQQYEMHRMEYMAVDRNLGDNPDSVRFFEATDEQKQPSVQSSPKTKVISVRPSRKVKRVAAVRPNLYNQQQMNEAAKCRSNKTKRRSSSTGQPHSKSHRHPAVWK